MQKELFAAGNDLPAERIFELYFHYVESAHEVTRHRNLANSFYLTLNVAFTSAFAWIIENLSFRHPMFLVASLLGMFLAYHWSNVLGQYRALNSAKFDVIHRMEEKIGVHPYADEWKVVKREKKYRKLSRIERRLPWALMVVHTIVAAAWLVDRWVGLGN